MRKYFLFVLAIILHYEYSYGQFTFYEVQLKDKNGTSFTLSDPVAYLSLKAIARRLSHKIPIDSSDLPVNISYLNLIKASGNVSIHSASKWFNTVCIATTNTEALKKIRSFNFVSRIRPVAGFDPSSDIHASGVIKDETGYTIASPILNSVPIHINGALSLDYGSSFNQIHLHEGEYLHDMGFHGEGMLIAVLDGGFYHYTTNPVFDSLRLQNRVIAEFDFVNHETSVDEDGSHGATVLSILAANKPGFMIGSAPKAGYFLLRTENEATETPLEEQNWAAAAEYADSAGADIISSSLGYVNFDNPAFNHSYAQRDGNTALITLAADMAAKKGLLVMNSAGNSGQSNTDEKYVTCPADGDGVLAVGAVDINGNISPGSSWGPNAAGKIKPDVVSLGLKATYSLPDGTITTGSGTSFSNPNLAGLVACLWQAFPEFTNMEIIDAVKKSSGRYTNPDERFGYGIPDMKKAYMLLFEQRFLRNSRAILGNLNIKAYPVPFIDHLNLFIKQSLPGMTQIRLIDINGKVLQHQIVNVISIPYTSILLSGLNKLSKGIYIIEYINGKDKLHLKIIK